MRIFARVVGDGSYTAAARYFNIATPSASRAVASLEMQLQVRLLNRNTRRVALTEAGERYLRHCEHILAYIDQAEAEASDSQVLPSGRLRVHATTGFGRAYVVPAIALYQQRYPLVSVDLTLSQHAPDILDEGYDVTLHLTDKALPDSGLISHALGSLHSVLCAAPDYLLSRGMPGKVADLADHECLQVVTPAFTRDRWRLDGPNGIEVFKPPLASFQVNLAEALGAALCSGVGIGVLPMSSAVPALREGTLLRVLPQYRLEEVTVHVMYASRRFLDAKIKTFAEHLKECIPKALASDQAELNL